MRLQVFLSHARVCSRRQAMELVQAGEVSVNGVMVREPSYDVTPGRDKVFFNNRLVSLNEKIYLLLHKPKGFVTTLKDAHAKRTVMDLLPPEYKHVYPVGRLDKDSEGLLLFTNDGDLTFRLLHPSFKVDKVYEVESEGCLLEADKARLEKGVLLEERRTHPAKIKLIYVNPKKSAFHITIHEGRKRQIRLMLRSLGYNVTRLKRIRYGILSLGNLKTGAWRVLEKKEIEGLWKACGVIKGG